MTRCLIRFSFLSLLAYFIVFSIVLIIQVETCSKTVHVPQQHKEKQSEKPDTILSTTSTTPTIAKPKKVEDVKPISKIDPSKCLCSSCDVEVNQQIKELSAIFSDTLYGQHIAGTTIPNLVESHLKNKSPKKSLVLSLHGSSGIGKTFTALSIMRIFQSTTFDNVQYFHGASLIRQSVDEQIKMVTMKIHSTTEKCDRAIFIFDEIDLLDTKLIDALFPYVEYQESQDGIDYRKTTFIFIGREAGTVINDQVIAHMKKDGLREDLQLIQFEKSITNSVYNGQGGLYRSVILQNGLIDLFVPFLPLERKHVIECIKHYLKTTNRIDDARNDELVQQVADSIQYFKQTYASTGCKKVAARTDLLIRNPEARTEL